MRNHEFGKFYTNNYHEKIIVDVDIDQNFQIFKNKKMTIKLLAMDNFPYELKSKNTGDVQDETTYKQTIHTYDQNDSK